VIVTVSERTGATFDEFDRIIVWMRLD